MHGKAMKAACAIAAIALLALVSCRPADDASRLKTKGDLNEHVASLEKAIPALMEKVGVPGMSIALIRDGKVVWSRGFGVKNTKTGEPVKDDTVFEAASLTKPFFAYLAMKFVEDGKIDLDKPLVDYAPLDYIAGRYIRHYYDREGFRLDLFRKITARMVLSHSSGLPHGEPRIPLPILFEPGTKFKYSAEGFEYLERIVEFLAEEPLHELMRKMVIEPLGMKDSAMIWRDAYEAQCAVGHDSLAGTQGEFRKRTEANAAASLYTTAADYGRFVAAVMNGQGLKRETIEKMLTPQIEVEKGVSWGLGFGLEQMPNGQAFWQWGDYGIFRNYVAAYPKKKIGVVYLTNSQNGLSIGQDILDLAIGGGRDLGLAYLKYPRYDTPAMALVHAVRTKGIDEAMRLFREARAKDPALYKENDLTRLGYALLSGGRAGEAVEVFKVNAEAFPDSANVYDSLAEGYMKSGDDKQAVAFYKKAIETAPRDQNPDKVFVERVVAGARASVEKLEKRISRKLGDAEAQKRYSRFTGMWEFDVQAVGKIAVEIFIADGLLWGRAEGGILGDRSEFIPVEGKPLDFTLDTSEQGQIYFEFGENAKREIIKSQFTVLSQNIRGSGRKKGF